jgi:malonate-semialdehyde dehydrogenase (acetylating)/methylmalonate-semialdehyde dehydrogenase
MVVGFTTLETYEPGQGEKIARVPTARADVDKAVKAAKAAFWEWRATPPLSRARYLFGSRMPSRKLRGHRQVLTRSRAR